MTIHYVDFGSESRRDQEECGPTRCSALDLELIRLVVAMQDQARAKLLAFLHLAQDNRPLDAEFSVSETGEVQLSLMSTPREAC